MLIPSIFNGLHLSPLTKERVRGVFDAERRRVFMTTDNVRTIFEDTVEKGTSSKIKGQLEKIKIGINEINSDSVSSNDLHQAREHIQKSAAETLKAVYEKAGINTNEPATEVRIAHFVNGVDLQALSYIKEANDKADISGYFDQFMKTFDKFETAYQTGTSGTIKNGFGILDQIGKIPNQTEIPDWFTKKFGDKVQIQSGPPDGKFNFTQKRDATHDTKSVMYFKMGNEVITSGRGFKDIQPIRDPLDTTHPPENRKIIGFSLLDGDGDMISAIEENGQLKRQFIDQDRYLDKTKKQVGDIVNASENRMRFFDEKGNLKSETVRDFFSGKGLVVAALALGALSKFFQGGANPNWGNSGKAPEAKAPKIPVSTTEAGRTTQNQRVLQGEFVSENNFKAQSKAHEAFEEISLKSPPEKQEIFQLIQRIWNKRPISDLTIEDGQVYKENIQKLIAQRLLGFEGKAFKPEKIKDMQITPGKITMEFHESATPVKKLILGEGENGVRLIATDEKPSLGAQGLQFLGLDSAAKTLDKTVFGDGITSFQEIKQKLSNTEGLLVSDTEIPKYTNKSLREGADQRRDQIRVENLPIDSRSSPQDAQTAAEAKLNPPENTETKDLPQPQAFYNFDTLLNNPTKASKIAAELGKQNPEQQKEAAQLLWKLVFTKPSLHSASAFSAISAHTQIMSQELDTILEQKGLHKLSLSRDGIITTQEGITLAVELEGISYKKGTDKKMLLSDEQAQNNNWKDFMVSKTKDLPNHLTPQASSEIIHSPEYTKQWNEAKTVLLSSSWEQGLFPNIQNSLVRIQTGRLNVGKKSIQLIDASTIHIHPLKGFDGYHIEIAKASGSIKLQLVSRSGIKSDLQGIHKDLVQKAVQPITEEIRQKSLEGVTKDSNKEEILGAIKKRADGTMRANFLSDLVQANILTENKNIISQAKGDSIQIFFFKGEKIAEVHRTNGYQITKIELF